MTAALRDYAAARPDGLRIGALAREDPGLYMAARRVFGSISEAVTTAGLPSNESAGTHELPWTPQSVLRALRARHRSGLPLTAHANAGLGDGARALFGGWRAALAAAGVPAPARGRPRRRVRTQAPAARPRPAANPAPQGVPPGRFRLERTRCGLCGAVPADLRLHVPQAHGLSPRRYELSYGALPDRVALFEGALAALRAYVAGGGHLSETALRRAEPDLHEAVVRLHLFPDVAAAFAYVRGDALAPLGGAPGGDRDR